MVKVQTDFFVPMWQFKLFLIEALDTFAILSGLKPNYDKLHIGSQKKSHFTLLCSLPIKWSDGDVDLLGIQIPKEWNSHSNTFL